MTEFTSKYQSQRNVLKSRGADSNRLYLSATIPLSIPRQKFWAGAMAFPNRTAPPPQCDEHSDFKSVRRHYRNGAP